MRETMTIGGVLEKLRACAKDKEVRYDFCGLYPTKLCSSRGFYDEAAIGFDVNVVTVEEMISDLECAIDGRTFTGYKGGEYEYTEETPLHVDEYGRWTDTRIKSIKEGEFYCYIKTAAGDY
jgi:hypothetical protein